MPSSLRIRGEPIPNKMKKAYRSPVLRRYGDVRLLTQAAGSAGKPDSAHRKGNPHPNQKTS